MQMVAASKMRRAQEATLNTRAFAQLLYRIQRHATTHVQDYSHALLAVREVRKRAVILVGTDKGLCGSLNTNLFRLASQFDPETTLYIAVGKRAAQFIARTRRQLIAEFSAPDSPRFVQAKPIAMLVRDLFLKGEVDEVKIIATRFVNTMTQIATTVEYLPIGEIKGFQIPGIKTDAEITKDPREVLFEPNAEAVMSYLFGHYLNVYMYRVLLEAKASEQSARMVAMTAATDNATALIKDLKLEYNKLRQGGITKELLEIAGGQAGNA
jgi:F-type H+-transporting ATPase subunit gamma